MRKATNDLKEANEKLESKLQQQEAHLVRMERELLIEAALEKVRSSSLAMHHSTELEQVAGSLFDRLAELGLSFDGALIFIFDKEKRNISLWIATNHLSAPVKIDLPYDKTVENNTILKDLWNAIENGEHIINRSYSGEVKNEYFRYVAKYNESKIPESIRQIQIEKENWTAHFAAEKNSIIGFDSWSGHPTKEEDFKILIRFSKVFEQAYTRFLDLQKAEAQAREAQIETAMEKIRSRSLAMKYSDELQDVALILFKKLDELKVAHNTVAIQLFDFETKDSIFWPGNLLQDKPPKVRLPYDEKIMKEDTCHKDLWDAMSKGEIIFNKVYTKGQKDRWFQYVFANNDTDVIHPHAREFILNAEVHTVCFIPEKNSALFSDSWDGSFYTEEELNVLKRAAKVFEQAYIRFLDLQKAEAHAREAQIQLGLERVRARTMAMHKSEELREAAVLLYKELRTLGVSRFLNCGYVEIDEENNIQYGWMTKTDGTLLEGYTIPLVGDEVLQLRYDAWKQKVPLLYQEVGGDKLRTHTEFTSPYLGSKEVDEMVRNQFTDPTVYYCVNFSHGYLHVITDTLLNMEEESLLIRFSQVFEMTYKRFLDLKRAEANTRLAVKQASLDRVRAEIASMRTPEDLQRIIPLVWNELTTLGIPFIRCGVFIIHEKEAMIEAYLSTPDGQSLAVLHLPFDVSETTSQTVDSWRKGKVYHQHWNQEDFLNWSRSLMDQGQIQSPETYQGTAEPPESLDLHFVPFTQGMLYVGATHLINDEEINLVKALAEAFAIAYARYEDFIKLDKAKENIETTLTELKATQAQLIQKEKLASLGELTAGIAHEIQNPLNFVNNYAEVNVELMEELEEELKKGDTDQAQVLLADLRDNESKIHHHGQRADAIVRGMLEHARTTPGERQPTDLNRLADEYLRLAYQGLRRSEGRTPGDPAKAGDFHCELITDFDPNLGEVEVVAPDIGRVLLNLYNNAFYAVQQNRVLSDQTYMPIVWVSTRRLDKTAEIRVRDNGVGIPDAVKQKIFQPFFTTKPTGEGTGLGLSLSYDIVTKGHGGTLEVATLEGTFTEFILTLPRASSGM